MGDRYLVTGGAGFIGSHLVRSLLGKNAKVRIVDNLSTSKKERIRNLMGSIEFLCADLADPSVAEDAVKGMDYIFHQAAVPSVQRSIQDPVGTNRANVTATLNLLESSRKSGVRRFIYAASSSVYGDTAILPKSEEMVPNPLSPYGLQKLIGERYCRLYYELYGLETVSLRYFNVFGPGQEPNSDYSAVIPKFVNRLLARQPITVYGDGEQSRDFTYVANVVQANLLAARAKEAPGTVCNVGCGERITLKELIESLEKILNVRADVKWAAPKAGDVRHSLADIRLARTLLGYKPQVDVIDGLRRTVEAFKSAELETR
jgi:UDP-N-acetylglucosamine/UDP-N-acetyl-alpha-D-glucosaminouronate 4-epimerase